MHCLAIYELSPGDTLVQMCAMVLLRVGCIKGYLEFCVNIMIIWLSMLGNEYMYAICVPRTEYVTIGI